MKAKWRKRIGMVVWWQVRHSCGHMSRLYIARTLRFSSQAKRVADKKCERCRFPPKHHVRDLDH